MIDMKMASWTFSMLRHQKEVQELQAGLNAILPVMTDPKETRETKRSMLNAMVNELSDKAFNLYPVAEQIMTIINMKEEVCKEYPDSKSQVDGILSWLPRFKQYRDLLLKEVKKNRKEYRLKL